MPEPPYPRAIALACSLATLRGRCLYVTCDCGVSESTPVEFLLKGRALTLADAVVRMRCSACRARPAAVWLTENCRPVSQDAIQPSWASGSWKLLLHGEVSSEK